MSILDLFGTPEVNYAQVVFGGQIQIEGYQFPDGEIRYSITGACELAGVDRTYLIQVDKRQSKPLKVLRTKGYTGCQRSGEIKRPGKRGSSTVKTISGDDLDVFVRFAADHLKKPKAIALLAASFSEVRRDRERSSFGLEPETPEEKIRTFEKAFDTASISNSRAALHEMGMDDGYNAPLDPTRSLRDSEDVVRTHEHPFD